MAMAKLTILKRLQASQNQTQRACCGGFWEALQLFGNPSEASDQNTGDKVSTANCRESSQVNAAQADPWQRQLCALSLSGSALAVAPASIVESGQQNSGFGPVSLAVDGISGLHELTGLPWWASLALTGIGLRLLVVPLTIQQMRAVAQNAPLLSQAVTKLRGGKGKMGLQQYRAIAAELQRLRADRGTVTPYWLVAAPLIQLPVFITVVMAVRRMAYLPAPGLDSQGLAWFSDLTLPAMSISSWAAVIPMGNFGIILPAAVTALTLANINQAFSNRQEGQASRTSVLTGSIRLLLELLTIPLFVTTLQLPQAVLIYWSTSSTMALAQAKILQSKGFKAMIGIGRPQTPPAMPQETKPRSALQANMSAQSIQEKYPNQYIPLELLGLNDKINSLFEQAARSKADGKDHAAVEALTQIVQEQPQNPRAWFALGQTFAGMKQWRLAEQAYHETVSHERDATVLSKAWLGIGVSTFQDGDADASIQALERAAGVCQESLASSTTTALSPRPAEALLFTAGQLQRSSRLSQNSSESFRRADLTTVLLRSLLSKASIHRGRGQLEEALRNVEEAKRLGADVGVMHKALLAEMASASQTPK